MSILQYALGIVIAWFLLPYIGRQTLYLWSLAILGTCLPTVGSLGAAKSRPTTGLAWATGSMLLANTFFFDITVGPVCYSLVSELSSSRLRSKTIVLARMSYNIANIISNIITLCVLNPGAWN